MFNLSGSFKNVIQIWLFNTVESTVYETILTMLSNTEYDRKISTKIIWLKIRLYELLPLNYPKLLYISQEISKVYYLSKSVCTLKS